MSSAHYRHAAASRAHTLVTRRLPAASAEDGSVAAEVCCSTGVSKKLRRKEELRELGRLCTPVRAALCWMAGVKADPKEDESHPGDAFQNKAVFGLCELARAMFPVEIVSPVAILLVL